MADINKVIEIDVKDLQAVGGLQNIDKAITKVTQSTKNLTKETQTNTQAISSNGGAMGILNQLTGGLAQTFKDAGEAIGLTGNSLKGLRGAIIATGLGALVIVLMELISNWDKWKGVIDGSTEALEKNARAISDLEAELEIYLEKSEYDIKVMELQGASSEKLYNERIKQIKGYIKYLEEQKQKEQINYQIQLARDSESSETESARLKRNAFSRKIQSLEDKARISYYEYQNKLTEDATKLQKEAGKIQADLLKEALANLRKIGTEYDKQIETLRKLSETNDNLLNPSLGAIEDKFTQIGEATSLASEALEGFSKKQLELYEEFEKNSAKLSGANLEELTNEFNTQRLIIEKGLDVIINLGETLSKLKQKYIADVAKENEKIYETIDIENKLYNLKRKSIEINSELFKYEESIKTFGDNRLDNSNKFIELEDRILKNSENRKNIIEATLGLERKQREERVKDLESQSIELKKQSDLAQEAYDNMTTSTSPEEAAKIVETLATVQGKQLQVMTDLSTARLDLVKSTNDYEIEMAAEAADAKLDIELNTIDKLNLLRDEKLERERMYYETTVGIAEEAGNFLNNIASLGGKNSEKFAKAALKIQKAAGVARVAIALQEEIRGIWANPALTALPDTGASAKTALTVGASARAALSVASILSQKIQSGGGLSSGGSGTGAAPQAQFDIVGSSGTNQLAAAIGSAQNQPVNAYVVSSSMTTQQALDRNRIQSATFL